jgi:3-dehydroquinate synthase/2-deoxy-scyllo-inosose synthase
MSLSSLTYRIGTFEVPFYFGQDCGMEIARQVSLLEPDRVIVLADQDVWALHQSRLKATFDRGFDFVACPHLERQKTLATVEMLATAALERGATRRSLLLGIGGGVVGNLTGMTAGLLYRGIRFAHMPTTLLAMHDSVTSLKQGVNAGGKNILGLFHAPSAVFVDVSFLHTLPTSHMRAGLVELVKNGLVLGGDVLLRTQQQLTSVAPSLLPDALLNLIQLGIQAKCDLLRNDPFERGQAMIMEYGHTIGHAIELAHGGELNHGDSVAWGMQCAAWIASTEGIMATPAYLKHQEMLGLLGQYPRPPKPASVSTLMNLVRQDNKRGYLRAKNSDSIAMVLLRDIGQPVNADQPHPLTLVSAATVERSIERLLKEWAA